MCPRGYGISLRGKIQTLLGKMQNARFYFLPAGLGVGRISKFGNFLTTTTTGSTSSFVCIIQEVKLPSESRGMWWLGREELEVRRDIRLPPPPNISKYSNLLK